MHCIRPHPTTTLTLGDGRVLTLVEMIGRGSAGEVHRAVLESGWGVRRPVAVKLIDVAPDDEQGELPRHLARVARRVACVRHPSVIQILEVDRTDHQHSAQSFVVMELVCGESLASLLTSWQEGGLRVPVDFALVVALKAAEGLGAALFSESADGGVTGLMHGDLSPRQILVSDQGDVKLGDFGQRALSDVVSRVRSRHAIRYTAPEVACGLEGDARSDVFSLGVILHEMLVGPRFEPKTRTETVIQMVRDGQFHLGLMVPNLPPDLRAVMNRAVAPNAADRYPHARALAFDLRREMLKMGLCDVQTSVRQAVVGWCELRVGSDATPAVDSAVVPRFIRGSKAAR